VHCEDYYSRKGSYAINSLVICDDLRRIRYENVGWPGSSHDNRVWRNCWVNLEKPSFFGVDEYLLGDSAYQSSNIMVPAYKTSSGGQLDIKEEYFNKRLARIRIRFMTQFQKNEVTPNRTATPTKMNYLLTNRAVLIAEIIFETTFLT
ncbi:DDE superfamily endonuclease, partial [Phytophthora infestans]